jgi:hypothetical protein
LVYGVCGGFLMKVGSGCGGFDEGWKWLWWKSGGEKKVVRVVIIGYGGRVVVKVVVKELVMVERVVT